MVETDCLIGEIRNPGRRESGRWADGWQTLSEAGAKEGHANGNESKQIESK